MYRILAQSFPNNEIRIKWTSLPHPKKVSDTDVLGDDEIMEQDTPVNPLSGVNSPAPLSLVPYSQTQPSGAGFGSLPKKPSMFGLNGKRTLIRQGASMEHAAPVEECLFLTGTLPGSTEASFRAIAEWSGYIVHRLKSWIGNYAAQKLDFYCWEYQKRGALHLHYCVHVPDAAGRAFILGEFHSWWIAILHSIGEKSQCDMFRKNSTKTHLGNTSVVRAVAETCRKSPARYLAKYLSKSATPLRGAGRSFTPSRWWGTSRPLKKLCESLTRTEEIAIGGYHAIRDKWEKVKTSWSTSEGGTFQYKHKFGMGETLLCYPSDAIERESLWESLQAMGTRMKTALTKDLVSPAKDLKVLRDRVIIWLSESLELLPESFQGLRVVLEKYLNMMRIITPSKSPEPLKVLLNWASRTSDLRSLCEFSPVYTPQARKLLQTLLDTLEASIEIVAFEGWR